MGYLSPVSCPAYLNPPEKGHGSALSPKVAFDQQTNQDAFGMPIPAAANILFFTPYPALLHHCIARMYLSDPQYIYLTKFSVAVRKLIYILWIIVLYLLSSIGL